MDLHTKLRVLMAVSDVSQKELAALINIPYATLNTYFIGRNNPPNKVLVKIAEYFNVSIDFLLNEKYGFYIDLKNNTHHKVAEKPPAYPAEEESEDVKELLKIIREALKDPRKKSLLKQFIDALIQE